MQNCGGLLTFADKNNVQSLFHSEGYFWLITATAISFAVEELTNCNDEACAEELQSKQMLVLFNRCIRNNRITDEELKSAKKAALADIEIIGRFNDDLFFFHAEKALKLCQAFTTYWLFFKLIELEWQEILDLDEINETYQFMDTVIADAEEFQIMAGLLQEGKLLDDDHIIYLRSHWQQVSRFFRDLKQDLLLLDRGLVVYQPLFD